MEGATEYAVRFVHKISPSDKDVAPSVELPGGAFADRNALGRVLRQAGVLIPGARVREFRVTGGEVAIFPTCPGLTTYWHCVVLTALPKVLHDRNGARVLPLPFPEMRHAAEGAAIVRLNRDLDHNMQWQGYGECCRCGRGANVVLAEGRGWTVDGAAARETCGVRS